MLVLQRWRARCGQLVPIYLIGLTEEGVAGAALVDDVSDQVLLSVVGGEDADAVRGVAQQTHVHVQGHSVLRFCQVLHREREEGGGSR